MNNRVTLTLQIKREHLVCIRVCCTVIISNSIHWITLKGPSVVG